MTDNTGTSPCVPSSPDPPLNLLSLDGGGIRGLSSLVILHVIMKRVQICKKLQDIPKPFEYFDLIGGTSTGGLIAIMLGKLKMSTGESLEKYTQISSMVFSPENRKRFYGDTMFKTSTLEDEISRNSSSSLGTATMRSCWILMPDETRKETRKLRANS
ncbi:hypothetical protein F5146DRAFT_1063360 [Armillaria mellea]|nr:hypothetical protein F5146DRAFT_1063360 [Armillaria mellea]